MPLKTVHKNDSKLSTLNYKGSLSIASYILLDAARMGERIEEAKELNPTHDSLYKGRGEEYLRVVAPYLFSFDQESDLGKWYLEQGWGDSWGILISSSAAFVD